jgi:rhodanese-related sulfurtransferase
MSDLIARDELAAAIDTSSVTLVDTLRPDPFGQAHLPGAINIPYTEVAELAPQLLPDKAAAIVVYCANPQCKNSSIAQGELKRMGYTNVRKYAEGIQDWEAAGLPVGSGVAA